MDIEEIDDEQVEISSLEGVLSSPSDYDLPLISLEPIIVRGNGQITIFGLNNRFSTDYPPALSHKLAPEEFEATVEKVNDVLRKSLPLQMKWMAFGCLCCCCSLGCSFWPVICMSKKTRLSIEKVLDWENSQLYRRLGIKWRLAQMHLDSSTMLEYVLLVDILPKNQIFQPD